MIIGKRLKELREQAGLSQEELGAVIGVSKSAISKQEKGISKKIDTISVELLAEKLNCSPEYLVGWSDKRHKNSDKFEKQYSYSDESLEIAERYDLADLKSQNMVRLALDMEPKKETLSAKFDEFNKKIG